jgi:predicted MFS family arabinose efflux permease
VVYVLLGGVLGGWSWRGPFLLYLMGLVLLLPSIWLLPEPARGEAPIVAEPLRGFPWFTALKVGAVTLLCSVVFFVQNVQHGRIFSDLGAKSPELISWVITAAGMATVLGGFGYHRLRHRPVGAMLAVIFLSYGLGYGGLAFAPNYWIGIPFDAMGQFAGGMLLPVLIGWTLGRYAPEYRGRGMGLWAACFFLGQFLSPPVVTLIGHGQWSFLTCVGIVGAGCFGCAAIAALIGRREGLAAAGRTAGSAQPARR